MKTFPVIVKLADGEKLDLDHVSNYSINGEKRIADVEINGYRQFFNLDYVVYIGRAFDLEGRGT